MRLARSGVVVLAIVEVRRIRDLSALRVDFQLVPDLVRGFAVVALVVCCSFSELGNGRKPRDAVCTIVRGGCLLSLRFAGGLN